MIEIIIHTPQLSSCSKLSRLYTEYVQHTTKMAIKKSHKIEEYFLQAFIKMILCGYGDDQLQATVSATHYLNLTLFISVY